jgi:hypothetical protein
MSKRARWDGPHPVDVRLPDGRTTTGEPNHLLPTEIDGASVPAAVRDDLLSRDDWSEVDQATTTTKKGDA